MSLGGASRAGLLLAGIAGCSPAGQSLRGGTPVGSHPFPLGLSRGPPRGPIGQRSSEPPWALVASRAVPPPITDVAALSGREGVFLARGGVFRWDGARDPVRVCEITGTRAVAIQAEGDRFVALGGSEGAPVVWRSEDRGGRCDRVALPSLSVQGHLQGALRLSLDHATAMVWSTSGLIARSDDSGARWRILPRIDDPEEVGAGPRGSTLTAVAVSTSGFGRGARAAIYQLGDLPEAGWRLLPGPGSRRMPMAFQGLADGSVEVLDALGTFTLTRDGAVSARRDFAEFSDERSVPRVISAASEGRFFVTTSGPLSVIDRTGARAFAWPSGLRFATAIDSATDETVWVTDGLGIWRGLLGGSLTELTERPLDGVATRMAARGDTLAMAGVGGQVAVSRDGGLGWQRFPGASGGTAPRAMAIDSRGTVLLLTSTVLLVCEGGRLSAVELPERIGRVSPRPELGAQGDRWVLIDGAVWTTDDQGARWTARFRPGEPSGATAVVSAVIDPRDRVLLLDQGQSLWLSTDAAMSFTRFGQDPFGVGALASDAHGNRLTSAASSPVAMAWDGESEAWLMHSSRVAHTVHGVFEVDNSALTPGEMYLSADGHRFVMAASAEGHLSPCPGGSSSGYLMVSHGEGYIPVSEVCEHRAAAWAFDGDRVYIVDPIGSVTRGSLSALGALADASMP